MAPVHSRTHTEKRQRKAHSENPVAETKTPLNVESPARREFCARACQAASLVTLGSMLQGCSGSNPNSPSTSAPELPRVAGSVTNRTITVGVGSGTPLASTGSAALVLTSLGTFLVARTGADTCTALTSLCTHDACTVSGFGGGRFVCPCHGSSFTTSGSVAGGPAAAPLRTYPSQLAGDQLTFTV